MSSHVSLFPVEVAAKMALEQKSTDTGDLAVSFLALVSLYEKLLDNFDEQSQALEVCMVRLGLGQKLGGAVDDTVQR